MNYEDPTQDLYIHLKRVPASGRRTGRRSGKVQIISGRRYRAYRHTAEAFKSTCKTSSKTENILKIPELVALVCDNVDTDIDISEMLWLANEVKISFDDIHTDIVPGTADTIDRILLAAL